MGTSAGGFPGGASGEELPAGARDRTDVSSIPGLGRSPGGEHGNPLQYSGLENPVDRGAWRATVHGVARVGHDLALSFFLTVGQNHLS